MQIKRGRTLSHHLCLSQIARSGKTGRIFFDHDPGEGNGNVIKIDGNTVAFPLETSDLNDGNHILYIRTQDDFGNWNMEESVRLLLKGSGQCQG